MPKKPTSTTPSLRSLALDHLTALAQELQAASPSLTEAQAVAKAAQDHPEGRESFRLYQTPGAELPWPEAVTEIAKAAALPTSTLAGGKPARSHRPWPKTQPTRSTPASAQKP